MQLFLVRSTVTLKSKNVFGYASDIRREIKTKNEFTIYKILVKSNMLYQNYV